MITAGVRPGKSGVWAELAADIPPSDIQWRIDGKPNARDGKYFARYVAYVDAQFVRARLDSVVPGEWDLTLELLPVVDVVGTGGEVRGKEFSFKARLQVLGVIREDVGIGDDYKSASSDAFKRAAVRFGIGTALYAFEQNWVQVDGDGKFAKPVEDPQKAYERRHGRGAEKGVGAEARSPTPPTGGEKATPAPSPTHTDLPDDSEPVSCPKCGGRMWDNRLTKRNAKAPDYKCQNRSCDGVIWPEKGKSATDAPSSIRPIATGKARDESAEDFPGALVDDFDTDASLPF